MFWKKEEKLFLSRGRFWERRELGEKGELGK